MNLRLCKTLLLFRLTLPTPVVGEQLTIIHAGQLLAIPGELVLDEQSILVSDGEIVEVIPGYAQVNVIDLTDKFVMPDSLLSC